MSPGTVLIVEAEPEVAELLEFNLQAVDLRTLTARDGLAACGTIGRQLPDWSCWTCCCRI